MVYIRNDKNIVMNCCKLKKKRILNRIKRDQSVRGVDEGLLYPVECVDHGGAVY